MNGPNQKTVQGIVILVWLILLVSGARWINAYSWFGGQLVWRAIVSIMIVIFSWKLSVIGRKYQ